MRKLLKMKKVLINIIILSSVFSMDTVKNIDIDKFMGKWYVISNIPNFVEKGCENAYDIYTLTPDGTIDVFYYAIKNGEEFTIKQNGEIIDKIHNSTWEMRFTKPYIPFYRAPYKVIVLDDDYNYMVVGYPGNTYGWIMARSASMEAKIFEKIMTSLEDDFGYDRDNFKIIKHSSKTKN